MAVVTDTYLEVYLGTTTSGSLVGHQIHESGSPEYINLDDESLGVDLNPGTRYCARAKCKNSDNVESEWYGPVPFQTKILAELTSVTPSCGGTLSAVGTLTYDTNDSVVQVTHCGVWYSKNSSGANYLVADDGDGRDFTGQGIQFGTNLEEHQTYYVVPFATDQNGETYNGSWAYARPVQTLYNPPTIQIQSTTHTYNSVGVSVVLNSTDSLKANYCYVEMSTSGGTPYKKLLTTTKGISQTVVFKDGQTDDNGNIMSILAGTIYTVRISAQNNETNGCYHSETTSVTTDQPSPASISLTISDVTPTSARANLTYPQDGGAVVSPDTQQ